MNTHRLINSIKIAQETSTYTEVKQKVFAIIDEHAKIHKTKLMDLCRKQAPYLSKKQIHALIGEMIEEEYILSNSDLLDMRKTILTINPIFQKHQIH